MRCLGPPLIDGGHGEVSLGALGESDGITASI